MAINKHHECEELNGVKCAVVERQVSAERSAFLKQLLEYNGYTVAVVPSPPPKTAAATPAPEEAATAPPPAPVSFTVGVTNLAFNAVNAVFGRMLRTPDGRIVTQAYWLQQESISNDAIPYYQRTPLQKT